MKKQKRIYNDPELERIKNFDWKNANFDEFSKKLRSSDIEEQKKAIRHINGLISFGNEKAFDELFQFFKTLPTPQTLEDVKFELKVLESLDNRGKRSVLVPVLIDKLYNTPSNNTTRKFITYILDFLDECDFDDIYEPLEEMIKDKKFGYKLKKRFKEILTRALDDPDR